MSGEHPKWLGETFDIQAFKDRRHHAPPAHRYRGGGGVTEEQRRASREQNQAEAMQRLEQLGIVFTPDGALDMESEQYVRVAQKRARIVSFDTNKNILKLSYEHAPQTVFDASVFSYNLSADKKENIG